MANEIYAAFDTTEGEPPALNNLSESQPAGDQLLLVQMIGPIKQEWFDMLQANAEIVSYVPNNAYLVRAGADGIQRLRDLRVEDKNIIQWSGPFRPAYKIAPELPLDSRQATMVT